MAFSDRVARATASVTPQHEPETVAASSKGKHEASAFDAATVRNVRGYNDAEDACIAIGSWHERGSGNDLVELCRIAKQIGASSTFEDKTRTSLLGDLRELAHERDVFVSLKQLAEWAEMGAKGCKRKAAKDGLAEWVTAFNKHYRVIDVSGNNRVIDLRRARKGVVPVLQSVPQFHEKHAGKRAPVQNDDGSVRWLKATEEWWRDVTRLSSGGVYDDLTFVPPHAPAEVGTAFNCWEPFKVSGKPGDWNLLKAHILDNICQGRERDYNWLMTWCAQIIQRPGEKIGSAVVARGKKGTGKTFLFDRLKELLGVYAISVSQRDQITGEFNAHQFGRLLVVCEEAFWAGDKQAGGALKHLITADKMLCNEKNEKIFEAPNYVRLAFASNEEWVVPTGCGEDERRYFVLECGEGGKLAGGRRGYFTPIMREWKAGGREAFMDALMTWKPETVGLTWDDLANPPETEAQVAMAQFDVGPIEDFLADWWDAGEIAYPAEGGYEAGMISLAGDGAEEPHPVTARVLKGAYEQWLKGRRYDGRHSWKTDGKAILGALGIEENRSVWVRLKAQLFGILEGEKARVFMLPCEADARAALEKAFPRRAWPGVSRDAGGG